MTKAEALVMPPLQRQIFPALVCDAAIASANAEERLMLAVLERAVDDFRIYAEVPTGRGRWLFTEAAAWFDSSATGPFDFEGICEATGLDPSFIRTGLRTWYGMHHPLFSARRQANIEVVEFRARPENTDRRDRPRSRAAASMRLMRRRRGSELSSPGRASAPIKRLPPSRSGHRIGLTAAQMSRLSPDRRSLIDEQSEAHQVAKVHCTGNTQRDAG
ncbi:MAG: hypothetical protein AB7P78_20235 [Candidatus Binatia bacterium]